MRSLEKKSRRNFKIKNYSICTSALCCALEYVPFNDFNPNCRQLNEGEIEGKRILLTNWHQVPDGIHVRMMSLVRTLHIAK